MNHITDNIAYYRYNYCSFRVKDLLNSVSVVTFYPVDDVDPEDPDQVQRLLKHCQSEYDKKDSPRYNIVIDLGAKGTRYYVGNLTGYDSDPLPYYLAWEADEVPELKEICKHLFLDAWEEEVKPFQF